MIISKTENQAEVTTIGELSEQLLLAVKMQNPVEDLLDKLSSFHKPEMDLQLSNDERKKAFWINVYNAYFQIFRKSQNLQKPEIYRGKHITIAGEKLSLDDVEHGILRRFRYKYSLGYLPNIFTPSLIRRWAVNTLDYRIHFALNCGAVSCPPIAFYSAERIEQQLELATVSFIEGDSEIKEKQKEVHVTSLFSWFRNDFGGTQGVKRIISKHLDKDLTDYKLVYKDYSWEEQLDNYDEEKFNTNVS